eukprot:3250646-Prymnesium_polylepis.1
MRARESVTEPLPSRTFHKVVRAASRRGVRGGSELERGEVLHVAVEALLEPVQPLIHVKHRAVLAVVGAVGLALVVRRVGQLKGHIR